MDVLKSYIGTVDSLYIMLMSPELKQFSMLPIYLLITTLYTCIVTSIQLERCFVSGPIDQGRITLVKFKPLVIASCLHAIVLILYSFREAITITEEYLPIKI